MCLEMELEGDEGDTIDALSWNNMKCQPSLGFSGAVCPWFQFYIYWGNKIILIMLPPLHICLCMC